MHLKTNWVNVYSEYLDYVAFMIGIWFLSLLLELESEYQISGMFTIVY